MGIHNLLLVVLTAVTWTAAAPTRNWTDASGRFSIEAEMVGFQDGLVHLQRADGKVVKVPLEKLSPADQEFAGQAAASSPKTEPPAAVAADEGVIRLPLADGMFQRTVWIDAMEAAGTGQATASLGDGSRPGGPLQSWMVPPLTEGYFLGLSGLPASPEPIAKVVMQAAPSMACAWGGWKWSPYTRGAS